MTPRLVSAMTGLVAVVAMALAIPMVTIVDNEERSAFVTRLEVDTLATASILGSQRQSSWGATVTEAAQQTGARIVVVNSDRVLVADSEGTVVNRPFDRPEIDRALQGQLSSDVRYSDTLGESLRYVAAPVVQGYRIVAAVRLTLPESEVNAIVNRARLSVTIVVVAVVLAAALISWILAVSISAPLRRVAEVAEGLGDDLERRADETSGPREVRSVAKALNGTARRLADLLRRQERVAADASHHLRTPLTSVRLRLEAIEDISPDEAVRQEAAAATHEVDRLSRRIEQVLALARADTGAADGVVADACEVAADCVAAATLAAQESGIAVEAHLPDRPCPILAPRGSLERALDELLGNALGYARARIAVSVVVESDDAVCVMVADDGPGIPESEREQVFERFQRGAQSKPGGSGLGLALVRELARAAGGDAVAERSSFGGLQVRLTWPSPL